MAEGNEWMMKRKKKKVQYSVDGSTKEAPLEPSLGDRLKEAFMTQQARAELEAKRKLYRRRD